WAHARRAAAARFNVVSPTASSVRRLLAEPLLPCRSCGLGHPSPSTRDRARDPGSEKLIDVDFDDAGFPAAAWGCDRDRVTHPLAQEHSAERGGGRDNAIAAY